MLATKSVGDNYEMWVTALAILVTNVNYLFTLASGTDIQKTSLSKFSLQNPQIVTNFKFSIYHDVTNLPRRSNRQKTHTLD